MNNLGEDKYMIVEELTEAQIVQLHALVRQQWWGGQRTLEDVILMSENTSLMLGLIEVGSHRLLGYCRVLTDFTFRATVYDVMVVEELQGRGLGKRLMETLCEHPRLRRVSFLYLCCEEKLFPFYSRWGFEVYDGKAEWMIKVQREESPETDR